MTPVPKAQLVHILIFALLCLAVITLSGIVFPLAMTNDGYGYLNGSEEIARSWRNGGSLIDYSDTFRMLGYPPLRQIRKSGSSPPFC